MTFVRLRVRRALSFCVLAGVAVLTSVLGLSPAVCRADDVLSWQTGIPRINGPRVIGAVPNRAFFHALPIAGAREGLRVSVSGNLPEGVVFDAARAEFSGKAAKGESRLTVTAANAAGETCVEIVLKIGDGCRLLTPPMGWSSWNAYEGHVNQRLVEATARALVSRGLAAHGYRYVNIDSCWQGERLPPTRALQPDPRCFPDMGGLVRTIHGLGLKAGIYTTPMVWAWGGTNGRLLRGSTGYPLDPEHYHPYWGGCGKVGYEDRDAKQFAAWGFDWLKYDWSNTDVVHARRMRTALDATGRDFVMQVCTGVKYQDADEMAQWADLVRANTDTRDDWKWLLEKGVFKTVDRWLGKIRPGFWYDPDMLAVGPLQLGRRQGPILPERPLSDEHRNRLTQDEIVSHFAWWAILPAPLFLSCDIAHLDDFTLETVTNDELIAINQDYPASPARPTDFGKGRRLWTRSLSDGRTALGFFNLGDETWEIRHALERAAAVRDVVRHQDLGTAESLSFAIPPHACRVCTINVDRLRPENALPLSRLNDSGRF